MELITVHDIAVFLSIADLPYLQERKSIKKIYENLPSQESLSTFMFKIDEQLEQLDSQVIKEISEIESKVKGKLVSCHFEKIWHTI